MYCQVRKCSRRGQDLPESEFYIRRNVDAEGNVTVYRKRACKVCYLRYLRGEPGFTVRVWLDPKPLMEWWFATGHKVTPHVSPKRLDTQYATIHRAINRVQNKGRVTATTVEQIAAYFKDPTLPERLYPEVFSEVSAEDAAEEVPDAGPEEDGSGRAWGSPATNEVREDQGSDRLGERLAPEVRRESSASGNAHTHDFRSVA